MNALFIRVGCATQYAKSNGHNMTVLQYLIILFTSVYKLVCNKSTDNEINSVLSHATSLAKNDYFIQK